MAGIRLRNRLCQLGTLELGSTRDGRNCPPLQLYACDFDSLRPKGTQGPGLWTLSEPDMRLLASGRPNPARRFMAF